MGKGQPLQGEGRVGMGLLGTRCISPIPLPTSPLKGEEHTASVARLSESFDPYRSRKYQFFCLFCTVQSI